MLHLIGCLYYLYQWYTVKQISDNEINLLIKCIKSVLWRVVKRLCYIKDARCLQVVSSCTTQWITSAAEHGVPSTLVPKIWRCDNLPQATTTSDTPQCLYCCVADVTKWHQFKKQFFQTTVHLTPAQIHNFVPEYILSFFPSSL